MHLDIGNLSLSGSLLFALICALLAHGKGRSVLLWGLLGFVFSCFALVFCLLVEDLSPRAEAERERRRLERRLKERRHGDRQRIGELERRVQGRLDAHDLALGLDTRAIDRPLPRTARGAVEERPSWFYEEAGATAGPVSRRALLGLLSAGALDPETLVWVEGMRDWAPLREVLPLEG